MRKLFPNRVRISTSEGRGLWEVEGVTSRARVAQGEQTQPVPMQPADQRGADALAVPERTDPAELRVAQANDGLWAARVDDIPLPVAGDLELAVAVPSGPAATLVLEHDQRSRDRALLVPLVALIGVLLLLPRWRRSEELPDPDLAAAAGTEAGGASLDLTDPAAEGNG